MKHQRSQIFSSRHRWSRREWSWQACFFPFNSWWWTGYVLVCCFAKSSKKTHIFWLLNHDSYDQFLGIFCFAPSIVRQARGLSAKILMIRGLQCASILTLFIILSAFDQVWSQQVPWQAWTRQWTTLHMKWTANGHIYDSQN